jgi:hypothetical protein
VENSLKHKSYLILLKYIPHLTAFMYIVYTIFQFLDVDYHLICHISKVLNIEDEEELATLNGNLNMHSYKIVK